MVSPGKIVHEKTRGVGLLKIIYFNVIRAVKIPPDSANDSRALPVRLHQALMSDPKAWSLASTSRVWPLDISFVFLVILTMGIGHTIPLQFNV